MDTSLLPAELESSIQKALELLRSGDCVAFPTDTVYGLGADPFNISPIIKLFEVKGRDSNKAIAVLVGDMDQISLITDSFTPLARKLVEKFWPGGLTVIVPKRHDIPDLLSPNQTIGIRMPNHPIALRLLNEFGPLATTSANISGKQNPLNAVDVHIQLNSRVPLILDGGDCFGGIPSTVVDCTGEKPVILREGAVPSDQIEALIV
ncbi:MAG: L-threonylcarbamoyladenylate synthase [Anaerolineaceae bacterium]|nr:L-threonylcarbamoyladenylate synthase [Anaerolineaceae bacterium]